MAEVLTAPASQVLSGSRLLTAFLTANAIRDKNWPSDVSQLQALILLGASITMARDPSQRDRRPWAQEPGDDGCIPGITNHSLGGSAGEHPVFGEGASVLLPRRACVPRFQTT